MSGVHPIEMVVQAALSKQAPTDNLSIISAWLSVTHYKSILLQAQSALADYEAL